MIIDSHTHIWVQQPSRYPWSPVGGYIPESEASAESLLSVMDSCGVDKAMLVQPTPYGWDNRYLLDSAKLALERLRVICLVDPFNPASADEMKKLVQNSGVSGFRFNLHLDPPERWAEDHNRHYLWKMADNLGCPICIQCTLDHVPFVVQITRSYPDVRLVIDHFAKPDVSLGIHQQKFQALLSLAKFRNIYIKLSGFYYASTNPKFYDEVTPFVKELVNSFGVKKCMWGSDFPFVIDRWSYLSALEWFKNILFLTEEDRSWIYGLTAKSLWW